jgi:hypothetical protein
MHFKKKPKQQDVDQKNNIIDGVFWAIMFYLITLFLAPFIIYFGATPFQVGLLESLPLFIGSLFGLFSYRFLKHFQSKKQLLVVFTILQAIICFLFGIIYFFINDNIIETIIILFIVFNILAVIARIIHTDWIGKVFWIKKMGVYTAQKQLMLELVSIVPILFSGFLLDKILFGQNLVLGFTIIFFIAGISRLIATYFLNKMSVTEDKEDIQKEIKKHKISLFKVIKKDVLDNKEYKYFLIVVFILYFSIFISSPFYKYYFLSTLNLNYFTYVSLHVITVISTVLSFKYWGKINDLYGSSKILKATVLFMPFYTFLLIFFYRSVYLLMLLNFFDGMVLAGFIIAIRTYFYQNTRNDLITHFALFSIIQALGIIIGTFFGSFIISKATVFYNNELHGMWVLFAITTFFRIVAVSYVHLIKDKYIKTEEIENIPKDIITYVPIRKGFNRFGRFLLSYERHTYERMNEFILKNKTKK